MPVERERGGGKQGGKKLAIIRGYSSSTPVGRAASGGALRVGQIQRDTYGHHHIATFSAYQNQCAACEFKVQGTGIRG